MSNRFQIHQCIVNLVELSVYEFVCCKYSIVILLVENKPIISS